MTQRLQERVQEGILQIDRFCALPLDAQRSVIEARLGEKLPRLQLRHGLLTPACFGASAWSHRDRLLLLTPAVIGLAAKAWDGNDSLENFAARMVDELDAYLFAANYHWEIETIQVLDREVSVPLLKFDDLHVESTRERAWPGEAPSQLKLPNFVNLLHGVPEES